jgi:hypothetical protein
LPARAWDLPSSKEIGCSRTTAAVVIVISPIASCQTRLILRRLWCSIYSGVVFPDRLVSDENGSDRTPRLKPDPHKPLLTRG